MYDGVCCDKRSVGRVCKVVGCCWLLVGTIESFGGFVRVCSADGFYPLAECFGERG